MSSARTPRSRPSSSSIKVNVDTIWKRALLPGLLVVTVLLGSLYHARAASHLIDGHWSTLSTSYFAKKSNILNQFFVKKAWAWTTLAWFGLVAINQDKKRGRTWVNSIILYLFATFYWVLITRWAWGPGIVERVFIQTGGKCVAVVAGTSSLADVDRDDSMLGESRANAVSEGQGLVQAGDILAHDYCTSRLPKGMTVGTGNATALQGQWTGGFDLSGHVFLLVHAILFLWGELPKRQPSSGWTSLVWTGVVALIALWWFMLLMTSLFFHTPGEKLVGLVFGLAEWAIMEGVLRF